MYECEFKEVGDSIDIGTGLFESGSRVWLGQRIGTDSGGGTWSSMALLKILEVDSQMLAFLVEVTSFEAECFGGLGDIPAMEFEFLENFGPLEDLDSVGECASALRQSCSDRYQFLVQRSSRDREMNGLGVDLSAG